MYSQVSPPLGLSSGRKSMFGGGDSSLGRGKSIYAADGDEFDISGQATMRDQMSVYDRKSMAAGMAGFFLISVLHVFPPSFL